MYRPIIFGDSESTMVLDSRAYMYVHVDKHIHVQCVSLVAIRVSAFEEHVGERKLCTLRIMSKVQVTVSQWGHSKVEMSNTKRLMWQPEFGQLKSAA